METVKDVLGAGRKVPIMEDGVSTPAVMPFAAPVAGAGMAAPSTDVSPANPPDLTPVRNSNPKAPVSPPPLPPPAPQAPATFGGLGVVPMPKPLDPNAPPPVTSPAPSRGIFLPQQPPAAGAPSSGSGSWRDMRVNIQDYRTGLNEHNTNATNRTVQDNELTSSQLVRLLDANGRYIQNARLRGRESAAARGMLMSSFSAGASERAAIEAGAPIAQADANAYGVAASENMRATNEDALADQGQGRQLFGQSMALDAQAQESNIGRNFQSEEAGIERNWRSAESGLDRSHQAALQSAEQSFRGTQAEFDRELSRALQGNQQAFQGLQAGLDREQQRALQDLQNAYQSREAGAERDWRNEVQARDQNFTAGQNEIANYQNRFNSYTNMQASREAQLSQQLSSIYSNTALTPAQQQAAATNARAIFTSITSSFNSAFSQGVPPMFAAPYPMPAGSPPPSPPPRP